LTTDEETPTMLKRLALILTFLMVAGICMGGSCNTVVRDEAVYRTELDFMEQTSKQPTDRLAKWIDNSCKCENGQFVDEWCAKTANLVQVIRARVPWHKAMMLYNASLVDKRPPKDPPEVPPATDLCPSGG